MVMKFLERNELLFNFIFVNISSGIAVGMMNFIIPVYTLSVSMQPLQKSV